MTATFYEPDVKRVEFHYTPHAGPQTFAHSINVDQLLYGGAAGGGKSKFARAKLIIACLMVPGFKGILFRRTFPDLKRSVVAEFIKEMPPGIATYHRTDHVWTFANGSTIELGHLQRASDLDKYQGAEYQMVIFEEATHFTEAQFDYFPSRCRMAGDVRARMEELGLRPQIICTANPGGVGHHWVKRVFVDPAPPMTVFRNKPTKNIKRPPTRCFVPAKATDNPSVNPEYLDYLDSLPPALRAAMRDGNWDVLEGVRFSQWNRETHVIDPADLPVPWVGYQRAVGIDYGSSAPFAALWGAKLSDDLVVIYRELYLKGLTPRQQAEAIAAAEAEDERTVDRPIPLVLDPSMWQRSKDNPLGQRGPNNKPPPGSIADAYWQVFGSQIAPARNDRVGGWALVDEQLRVRGDGYPRLLVYSTCTNLIRTLPSMPRDKRNPDDVDTTSEDHAPDALRYLLQELIGKPAITVSSMSERFANSAATTVTGDLQGKDF